MSFTLKKKLSRLHNFEWTGQGCIFCLAMGQTESSPNPNCYTQFRKYGQCQLPNNYCSKGVKGKREFLNNNNNEVKEGKK